MKTVHLLCITNLKGNVADFSAEKCLLLLTWGYYRIAHCCFYSFIRLSIWPLIILHLIPIECHLLAPFSSLSSCRSFFLADRSVFCLPIALTILASFISPITLLGFAAETYYYGGHYLLLGFQTIPATLVMSEILIPVFYGLEITTAYQVSLP